MGIFSFLLSSNEKQARENYRRAREAAECNAKLARYHALMAEREPSIEAVVRAQNDKLAREAMMQDAAQAAYNRQQNSTLGAMGVSFVGTAPAKPKLATDLPMTRAADLAGYLGRVQELLTFAALLTDKVASPDAHAHFERAAAKAGQVQLDLLTIVQEQRDADADAVEHDDERSDLTDLRRAFAGAQWSPEELERYRRANTAAEPINRIKPMPECEACEGMGKVGDHDCLTCGGDGMVPAR